MVRTAALLLATAAASFAAVLAGPAQAARKQPNLSVAKLSGAPAQAQPGAALTVSIKVRNGGRAKGAASTLELVLSADKRRDARDVVLGTGAVKALAPG